MEIHCHSNKNIYEKSEIKVLSIAQLPKEVGGTYTSGIARVAYELSKQSVDGVETYMYATNISSKMQ